MSAPRDVRMRGFAERTSVPDAIAWIDAACDERAAARRAESVGLSSACRRVLANDVAARMSVPPFTRSAMDGYAVVAEATIGANDYTPLELRVVDESLPGKPATENVTAATCVRVMTGAPIPAGADAVVPVEFTSEADGILSITAPLPAGKNVGDIGEDVREGDVLLSAGRCLRPQDIGLLASIGVDSVDVFVRPRVRILTTGNELAEPGTKRGPWQIFDANTSILSSLVDRDFGALESVRRVEDTREAIAAALTDSGADVILVSGGSSVGKEDFAPSLLAELGELPIHGIAMRPSSPAGMGRIGETLVFLLPGNPVSCLCAYDFFAGRAIRQLGGRSAGWPYAKQRAPLAQKIVSAIGRTDYCRVHYSDGKFSPIAISGASILSSTTRADGFVIVPAGSEGFAANSDVTGFLYSAPSAEPESY